MGKRPCAAVPLVIIAPKGSGEVVDGGWWVVFQVVVSK